MPKYHSVDTIPAKVFFKILKDKDYQQLKPKPKEDGLKEVFDAIYDEFFVKTNNNDSNNFLQVRNNIAYLEYKIHSIKQILHLMYYNKYTLEFRLKMIEQLKTIDIYIDEKANFEDEVLKVLNVQVGTLNFDLTIEETKFKNIMEGFEEKDFDYFERLGIMSENLPNNSLLKEDMTLATYIALSEIALKKNKR